MTDNKILLDKISKLEEDINILKQEYKNVEKNNNEKPNVKKANVKKTNIEKSKRKESEYNKFIKEYLSSKKKELGDLYDHKKEFSYGAKLWSEKKKNTS